jgi:hypothetical protein
LVDEIFADSGESVGGPGDPDTRLSELLDPRQTRKDELSTAKVQCFAAGYLRMHRKYKMLWFELDLHHRQRYFSICGCNRTLKMFGANDAVTSPATEENSR